VLSFNFGLDSRCYRLLYWNVKVLRTYTSFVIIQSYSPGGDNSTRTGWHLSGISSFILIARTGSIAVA